MGLLRECDSCGLVQPIKHPDAGRWTKVVLTYGDTIPLTVTTLHFYRDCPPKVTAPSYGKTFDKETEERVSDGIL